jgi:hypothetical protein
MDGCLLGADHYSSFHVGRGLVRHERDAMTLFKRFLMAITFAGFVVIVWEAIKNAVIWVWIQLGLTAGTYLEKALMVLVMLVLYATLQLLWLDEKS